MQYDHQARCGQLDGEGERGVARSVRWHSHYQQATRHVKWGEGKSGHWSVFTIEFGELKRLSPKMHLPKLKEIADV